MFKRARQLFLLKKWMHRAQLFLQSLLAQAHSIITWLLPVLGLIAGGIALYDVGFHSFYANPVHLNQAFRFLYFLVVTAMLIRLVHLLYQEKLKHWKSLLFQLLLTSGYWMIHKEVIPFLISTTGTASNQYFLYKGVLYLSTLLLLLTESAHLFTALYKRSFNPALMFVLSFLFIILLGTGLLLLPRATVGGISLTNALFTSTSAVCVTGLTVLDTATTFTVFGKTCLLMLIQLGGLGIMTFAGLLGYALSGGATFQSQLALKDMMSSDRLGDVMKTVYQIIFVTFVFEAIGAVAIYVSIDGALFPRKLDQWGFSIFHSISAFCNAGFSTYSQGLYDLPFRFNYNLHLAISVMVILGGMGFPIVFNLYRYLLSRFTSFVCRIKGIPKRTNFPRVMQTGTRLALKMTALLLVFGAIAFFLFERQGSLQEHQSWWGKIVSSIFGSVTPRTAGFNTIDVQLMQLPTIMVYLLLMWIGASPGSTGGGIKTTTAAVAFLNMASIIRGKDRTEYNRTEISKNSINRAFAIMMLSLIFIGLSVFLLSINDGHHGLIKLSFEAFSAFSTVGLSLNLTPQLSPFSKVILIVTMFVGRVGTLTLLMAIVKQQKQLYYRYPTEDIPF
jgi:trk system potassium uptake protein TrkH